MKLKTTIKLPTYSCSVYVIIVDSVMDEADRLYKKYNITEPFGDEAEGALLLIDSEKYYLLFHKDFITHNTLAHEIFHTTIRITEDRDIIDEEAQAWLAGHIASVIYRFLYKMNIKVGF